MKIYKNKNVLRSAFERFSKAFSIFDHIYLSVSGGKDSSVMFQLAAMIARKKQKKFSILFVDLEAQYKASIDHMQELIEFNKDVLENIYWVCLPLSLRNAVSIIQPKWICWDSKDKKKWVRNMPKEKYVISENNIPQAWNWFDRGMEFEDFIIYFSDWFQKEYGGIVGSGVGIRSDESLNRFRTIVSDKKIRYENYAWTTKIKFKQDFINVYSFFPLYDWRTEDIWGCISKYDMPFNEIYELMYKNGLSIHEQRLCQPYGDDQKNGLDQFKALEYDTWEKVLNRVHGVNFGNIYCRSSLLGNIKSEKPDGMNWQQYTVWLLETIGIYSPELRDHYYRKIKTFAAYWKKTDGIKIEEYPDAADKKLESHKKIASWRRIARAIERNDFWMKRLSFSQTKSDVERLFELRKKYSNLLDVNNTNDKHLKQVWEKVDKGVD